MPSEDSLLLKSTFSNFSFYSLNFRLNEIFLFETASYMITMSLLYLSTERDLPTVNAHAKWE